MLIHTRVRYPAFLLVQWKKSIKMRIVFWFFSPLGITKKVLSDLYFFKKTQCFFDFFFNRGGDTKRSKKDITTQLRLLKSAFVGGTRLFRMELWIQGVGFKFKTFLNKVTKRVFLKLALGFSHILLIKLPKTCTVSIIGKKKLYFKGYCFQDITCLLSYIQDWKLPDPYLGKGINFRYKVKKLKPGKIV